MDGKKVLFIGGAESYTRQALETLGINPEITNIDMYFNHSEKTSHWHIKKDFFEHPPIVNEFDYVFADYSLPLYALTTNEAKGFFAQAAIYLKPGGEFRAYPIEGGDPFEQGFVNTPKDYDLSKIIKASHDGVNEIAEILKKTNLADASARTELNPPNMNWTDYMRMRKEMGKKVYSFETPDTQKFGCMWHEIIAAVDLAKKENPIDEKKLKYLEDLKKYSSINTGWISTAKVMQNCVKAHRAVITAPSAPADKAKFNEFMLDYAASHNIPAALPFRKQILERG